MAQHDYNIANQSGADFRSDLNNALSAIASTNSGDTSPTTTFANQLWIDTANNVLKIRNEGNSAWITTGISITADNTFNIDGGTVNGITALSFSSGSSVTTILDEDNLGSNSATALATQQSIKAYVDSQVGSVDTLAEILTNGNTTGGTDISLSSSDITGTGNINITGTIQSSGAITGNLTGNVTGNASTATALQTARTINGASFDGTANISFNTDSVSEGSSNLYFTNARVESYLDAGSATPTFASAVINSSLTGSAILDDDTFGTASATTVATSESIKAYVDSQVATADTLAEVLANGNTTGGTDIAVGTGDDITFASSSKAIFGANSDLSIYSDGTTSIIEETGPGALNIQGTHLNLKNAAGNASYLAAIEGGAVTLYNSGSAKLATSSTGIDVTGTVVSDGLTVDSTTGFSWLPVSTAGVQLGTIGTGTGLIINTPSVNSSFGSGLAIDGSYASDLSSVNIKAFGAKFSSYGSELNLFTSDDTSLLKRQSIASNGDISFYDDTGSSAAFFWDASAEALGIGTTLPDTKMHISDTAGNAIIRLERNDTTISTNDIYGEIQFEGQDASAASAAGVRGKILGVSEGTTGSMAIAFHTASSYSAAQEALRIDSNQNVGIGTDSPLSKLNVKGTQGNWRVDPDSVSGEIQVLATTTANDGFRNFRLRSNESIFENSGTESMRIDTSNNLLVGKSSAGIANVGVESRPSGLLFVTADGTDVLKLNRLTSDGTIQEFRKDGSTVGSISVTSSATTYNTSSDARLKDVTGEARGLEVINELNPVSYNWKADGKADEGLIAQEVQEIVPNAVSGSEEEHYQMDYSKLVVHLVKAVKEQQEQIESLKGEIANLKGE